MRIVKLGRREARLGGGVEAAGRAAGDDLHHAGSEADEDADFPGAVVGTGEVEDQPAAERAERGPAWCITNEMPSNVAM